MKKIITALFCVTFLIGSTWQDITSDTPTKTQLKLIYSDLETSKIEFSIDGFHLTPVKTPAGDMYLIKLDDGASLLLEGSPDVHKYSRSIIIPDQAKMEVKVISSEFVEYRDVLVAPSKGNLSRLIDPKDVSYTFGDVYQNNEFFPGEIVGLENPYILRDLRGQTVVFNPIQYNPVQKILRVYQRILVEVSAAEKDNINIFERSNEEVKYSREFLNIYQNHFLNFDEDSRFTYLVDHGNMLVISYGTFMDEMQPLVDWKNKKGIPTEMLDVSNIGSNSSAIQNFVSDYYNDNGLTFLLLVGDIAQIPSPSVGGSASDPTYGFILGNDSYAEVIVGRFSGSNSVQISTQVERSIEYERYPQLGFTEWYDDALGIASNQGTGFGGYDDDEFNDFLWETVLSPFTYDSYEGIYDPSGTDQQGITAINNGVSLINYTGHGSINSWGNGASLNTSQINSLENDNLLPFVITVGCNVGEFQSTNECFCEAWQRATHNGEPTGSIGHYGSTISQSWEPPMHGQYGMNLILTESYNENLTRTIGGIATNGCLYMNDAQGSQGINETKYWTMFGDPSVPIRTAPPTIINAEFEDVIILGANTFSAYTGTEGDLVALSLNGELLAYGYTDESGTATLELGDAGDVPGELDLVITGFNYIPYESTVMVLSPDGPYLVIDNVSVNSGLDEIIEFGESVELTLALENVGNDDASDVTVTITSSDSYISITNGIGTISYIGPNETAAVSGLSFDVSIDVPDEHNFDLSCVINAGSETWESTISLIAYAPLVSVGMVAVDDENGQLDPGDTADLIVTLVNDGGAAISNVAAILNYPNDDGLIIVNDGTDELSVIPANSNGTITFNVTVADWANIGSVADFIIEISADNNYSVSDQVSLTIGLCLEDFESGDFVQYPWEFNGNAEWTIAEDAYEGNYAAKSGAISHNQTSVISVTLDVFASDEISFYYKVSSENNYDYLKFYIDGSLQGEWAGDVNWSQASFYVNAGNRTFTWEYDKDGSVSNGSDCSWVDYIIFPPSNLPTPPQMDVDPISFDVSVPADQTLTEILSISNVGGGSVDYSINLIETTSGRSNPDDGSINMEEQLALETDQDIEKKRRISAGLEIEAAEVTSMIHPDYAPDLRATDVTIVCDGGDYQYEVSWRIVDPLGNIVASGGAPFNGDASLDNGVYTVYAEDSFGDGWNGNYLTVTGTDGTEYLHYTLANGSEGTTTFEINAPDPLSWISLSQSNGSILGGDTDEIEIIFDTADLEGGSMYTCDMEINSNVGLITVPVTLTVGALNITVNVDNLNDWNMVGLPLIVENADCQAVFPGSIENTLYSFDENGYGLNSELSIGNGYWLRFGEAGTSAIYGEVFSSVTISLNEGWNMISGCSLPNGGWIDPLDIVIPNTLYGFGENGYFNSPSIEPGYGYWIRANATGEIIVTGPGGNAKVVVDNTMKDANQITINGTILYFGIDIPEERQLSYSLPPKPPVGAADVRFENNMKYAEEGGLVEVMSNRESFQIDYQINVDAGEKMQWVLVDQSTGQEYELKDMGHIELDGTADSFMLKRAAELPKTFVLSQNYPNPFNPVTTINYELPEESFVTIRVYNLVGQQVTDIVSKVKPAGYHQVMWNGKDQFGEPMASGIYIYSITAKNFHAFKKMVLMK